MDSNWLRLRHRNKFQLDKVYRLGIASMKNNQEMAINIKSTFTDSMFQQRIILL
jgi:hypothetical protein